MITVMNLLGLLLVDRAAQRSITHESARVVLSLTASQLESSLCDVALLRQNTKNEDQKSRTYLAIAI